MTLAVRQDQESKSRIEELFSLTGAQIVEVISQGYAGRQNTTSNHPRTYPGLAQWADTVRALRDVTLAKGWDKSDANNFPLSVHPDGSLVIAVQTGDRDTGVATGRPSNRAAKGKNTEEAVFSNEKQIGLFDGIPSLPEMGESDSRVMWVLLYYIAPNEIRFELSLPYKMVGGKIREWSERLVFEPISIDKPLGPLGDDDGTEFDVPVARRS